MDEDDLADDFQEEDGEIEYDDDDDQETTSGIPDDPSEDETMSDGSDDDDDNDNANDSEAATPGVDTPAGHVSPEPPVSPPAPPATTRPVPPTQPSVPSSKERSLSPATARRERIKPSIGPFSVEAVCALPHPCPTHSLASSACVSHLLTGSDDGYIRDYDIFPSLNGRTFLSAPQRHHAGVVEGILKAGQLRSWWQNPDSSDIRSSMSQPMPGEAEEETRLAPVFSLAMHSDALWAVSGTDSGKINMFTVRHEPGHRFHVIPNAHRGPVSSLCLDRAQSGLFSAGWDGVAVYWDLNSGQESRRFQTHGAQLSVIALKPLGSAEPMSSSQVLPPATDIPKEEPMDEDARSDTSFDPLFDEPDPETDKPSNPATGKGATAMHNLAIPGQAPKGASDAPKNAPPILDSERYNSFSPDVLMTAFVDGQVVLWDCRVNSGNYGVGRLWMNDKTPPWCMSACWSTDGTQIYAGRRNGTIDVWDVRQLGRSGPDSTPRLFKTLRNPPSSGVVSSVVSFPDNRHIACASIDNLRLWNVLEANEHDSSIKPRGSSIQFKIIPGHHGGYISQMLIDRGGRFLVTSSSNRGWHGDSTRTVFVHDIKAARGSGAR